MTAKLLISPNLRSRQEEIIKLLTELDLEVKNPDVMYFKFEEKLGVEQVHRMIDHLSFKSYLGKYRALIIEEASNLTPEAQNSLLKTLEELSETSVVILGSESQEKLLPTILSRCLVINLTTPVREDNKEVEKLITADTATRFEYIEKLKDRDALIDDLIYFFRNKLLENQSLELENYLDELLTAKEWQKGNVNIRGILEYLMLKLPKSVK